MSQKQTILLTGITGAVGSWIAAEALRAGNEIIAIVRDEDTHIARKRVRGVLALADAEDYVDGIRLVSGDVCKGLSGLVGELKGAGISSFFHCAALTDFSESNLKNSRKINVKGTLNVLSLAEGLGVGICHISTAYIAGKRSGVVREDETDVGQDFNNIYEQTKCEAEVLVRQWAARTGLRTFVMRPSIVIGDQFKGRIANFSGMYKILRFFDVARKAIGKEMIRVPGRKDVTKNLIPVDYLARTIMHVYANGEPNTYHITNPEPLSLGQMQEIYIRLFDLNGDIVDEEDFQRKEASRAEAMFQKASALYAPYMAAEPVFDRTNTDEVLQGSDIELPKIDKTYFDRLLGYARSVRWGKEKGEPAKSGGRMSKIRGYFDDFLNAKLNEHLLSELRSLSARFRIVLKEDPQMHWTLEVREGSLVTVSDDGMVGDCSFIVGSEPLARIVSAKVSPQEAFLNKDVEIAGDMATGLKLVTMLAEFFRKYPYDIR